MKNKIRTIGSLLGLLLFNINAPGQSFDGIDITIDIGALITKDLAIAPDLNLPPDISIATSPIAGAIAEAIGTGTLNGLNFNGSQAIGINVDRSVGVNLGSFISGGFGVSYNVKVD